MRLGNRRQQEGMTAKISTVAMTMKTVSTMTSMAKKIVSHTEKMMTSMLKRI